MQLKNPYFNFIRQPIERFINFIQNDISLWKDQLRSGDFENLPYTEISAIPKFSNFENLDNFTNRNLIDLDILSIKDKYFTNFSNNKIV